MGSVGSALVPRGCLSLSHYLRKRACANSNFPYSVVGQGTTLVYKLATVVAIASNVDTDSRGAADSEYVLAALSSLTGPLERQLRLIS